MSEGRSDHPEADVNPLSAMDGDSNFPLALVLMKFSGDSWNDLTYRALCDVLEEAKYRPLRSDEFRTSGPVVDEVCTLIENAPLVLIDTSGDSSSVSYELGFAHGVGRSFETTIVLRSQASGPIPFNYAHFRLLVYRDRRHLKQVLRFWLNISTPIQPGQLGYALNFSIKPNGGAYGTEVANAILAAIKEHRFSGRCEYYAGDYYAPREFFYIVGLALRTDKRTTPQGLWWNDLVASVSAILKDSQAKATLNANLSELCEIGSLRTRYLPRGVVEFKNGLPVSILGDGSAHDSWFLAECSARMPAI